MKTTKLGLAATVLALTLGSAACAQADEDAKAKSETASASQTSAQASAQAQVAPKAAEKVAAQQDAPPPISAYVGKYPFDKVQGVSFFEHPVVRAAILAAGIDRDVQRFVFFDDNVVGPIKLSRGRLMLHGYDPAGAGVENWAILLVADGSKAAVCYSTGVEQDVRGADWYFEGRVAFTLYEACPSEEGDIEGLADWPIGPIPS